MRKLIQFLLLALSFVFLASCGGSEVPGSSGTKASLKAGYSKIQKGMTPEQVIVLVGSEPSYTYRVSGQTHALNYWTGTIGTNDYAVLNVNFDVQASTNNGVKSKSYSSLDESESEEY